MEKINYQKRTWKNKQTALSAQHLNNIEDGVANATTAVNGLIDEVNALNTAVINKADNESVQVLREEVIELDNAVDNLITEVNDLDEAKQDRLSGSGDIIVGDDRLSVKSNNFEELEEESLNNIVETGTYKITNALDTPDDTSENGVLKVQELGEQVSQEWLSETNRAFRLYDKNGGIESISFYVNGVKVPQGTVHLDACGVYELQGDLIGHIEIGEGEVAVNNRTKIILKGVNIKSDAAAAINYTPKAGKLVVEIIDNSKNYLLVENGEEAIGALHSENNLMINGIGYLTIKNNAGHGIKASELIINGNIHAYLDTYHDAVHGGKLLKITNGYFEVENANDAFSASEGKTDDGKLLILGGEYKINNCKEAAFEGKSANGIKRIINSKITFGEGCNKLYSASNASEEKYGVKFIAEGTEIINNSAKDTPTLVSYADIVGPAKILVDGDPIDVSDYEIVLTPNSDKFEYVISGDFSGKHIVVNPTVADYRVDFLIKDFYYKSTDVNDLDSFILHTGTRRIKFKSNEFTLAYLEKAAGCIFETAKNIQFTSKGDMIIKAEDEAIKAENGYIVLGNDGVDNIIGKVQTSSLRLGKDIEDTLEYYPGNSDCGVADTAAYLKKVIINNSEDLYANQIVDTQYHTGLAIIDEITAIENTLVYAQAGLVHQKEVALASYNNRPLVYIPDMEIDVEGDVFEVTYPEGVEKVIPSIEPTTSDWIVYKGAYSKEEIDAKFVTKTEYNRLIAELDNRAPKKVNIINYVEDTTKEDHRPAKDHAYCPVEIVNELTEETETVYVADSIEVFRYACPERIDIDDVPETHGDYIKDGRQMYARDGDFGYPEIDKTGQFNFRPVWNEEGYVIVPEGITPANGYKNFKTQWNIGIPGMYRFTKVNSDLTLDLHAVKEDEIPAHVITYKFIAPVDYPVANLPEVRVFRGADHCEKFMKYGPGAVNPPEHPILDNTLISGNLLGIVGEPTVEEIDGVEYNVWTVLDKAYDDANGLPSADTTGDVAKVYFNVAGELAEGYACEVSAKKVGNNYNKMNNPTEAKKYYTLTKVAGDIEVTLKVVLDLPDVTLTFVNNANYVIENTAESGAAITEPITINALKDFQFKVDHNLNDKVNPHPSAITSVLINGVESTILKTDDLESADAAVVWKSGKNKDECRIKKAYIPADAEGTIVITVDPTHISE